MKEAEAAAYAEAQAKGTAWLPAPLRPAAMVTANDSGSTHSSEVEGGFDGEDDVTADADGDTDIDADSIEFSEAAE